MIDIRLEPCMSLKELTGRIPVKRSTRTLYRYCRQGVLVRGTKRRVKLEFLWVEGDMYSSVEAFNRFLAALKQGDATDGG